MQWLANTLGGLVAQYPDAKPLQRTGLITRENLLKFFHRGLEMFDSVEVKKQLKVAHAEGKDVPSIITSMQMRVFEDLGLQGDFAIAFLARVQEVYQADQEVMARFYNFVNREEMACDEAEMDASEFEAKYAKALAFQEEMKKKSVEMSDMSPEQRQEFLQQMMQQTALMQDPACGTCAHNCSCEPTPPTNQAMTQDEQLAFFQSLNKGPK